MTKVAAMMNARQAAGLCRRCGAPQVPGCALCEVHRDEQRAARKAKYAARKAAGKCIDHGCGRKARDGRIRCRPCHAVFTAYQLQWQREHRGKGKRQLPCRTAMHSWRRARPYRTKHREGGVRGLAQ